ncbi:MAG: GNAT family N-acetyltransferase [Devosia sp.]|nr:GNAT family N-acetyltransferase [Devosia sp.]
MLDGATLKAPLARTTAFEANAAPGAPAALGLEVSTTRRIEEVETIWRALEAQGVESPGQSYDFTRLWIEARQIPVEAQLFVVASLHGQPVALLPLHRVSRGGVRVYTWFAGTHVGCGAPLLDVARFTALTTAERQAFWRLVLGGLHGADLVHLATVPEQAYGIDGLFAELGRSAPVTETLYRAAFSSWEQANTTQRSKSRRKHDRQQGERLDALGKVSFEVLGPGEAAGPVLAELFRQRARRFEVMGVADPFAAPDIARFYAATVAPGSAVAVKLHVLRLDGEIVAMRYNIEHGDRLFCLISSMSDDDRIQGGSPGKQCLLRVMQTIFDAGYRVFDMGNGFTDEKRHWCNVQIGLRSHYVPLTLVGRVAVEADQLWRATRASIKANKTLLGIVKAVRARLHARRGADAVQSPTETEPSE